MMVHWYADSLEQAQEWAEAWWCEGSTVVTEYEVPYEYLYPTGDWVPQIAGPGMIEGLDGFYYLIGPREVSSTPSPDPTSTPPANLRLSAEKAFSPNSDTFSDTSFIQVEADDTLGQWTLRAIGEGYDEVIEQGVGNDSIIWNGVANGMILPVGTYQLQLSAAGEVKTEQTEIARIYEFGYLIALGKSGNHAVPTVPAGPGSGGAPPTLGFGQMKDFFNFKWGGNKRPVAQFTQSKLVKKFKHAPDFGLGSNLSATIENAKMFGAKVQAHINARSTSYIRRGTYRGDQVIHFYDPVTRVNVMLDRNGHFVSGWRLTAKQEKHLKTTGDLGGD